VDNDTILQESGHEFYKLGFTHIIPISATHGTGIAEVLEKISEWVGVATLSEPEAPLFRVAFLGRPNVGKSSLMNALLRRDRSIVSEVAGTTREELVDRFVFYQNPIELVDTPGVRRMRKISDPLEELMAKSSFRAVRILVIDASAGTLTDQELKLLFYVFEKNKSILLVFNKVDLITEEEKAQIVDQLSRYEFILKKVPQLWTSCITKKNVGKICTKLLEIWNRACTRFDIAELKDVVRSSWGKASVTNQDQELKIHSVRQIEGSVPSFVIYVNKPLMFKESHRSFIENILRKNFDLVGCSIRLELRKPERM